MKKKYKYKSRMADMRAHSEWLALQRESMTSRKCLKCDSTFQSSGNRICDECKRSDIYNECQEDYRIGV